MKWWWREYGAALLWLAFSLFGMWVVLFAECNVGILGPPPLDCNGWAITVSK